MKKLIIREVISVILVVGVFLSIFTLPNGWDKAGKERYEIAIVAVFWAVFVAYLYFRHTCLADAPKNNAPKKVILFSLWVTALAIILPIVLIIVG